MPYIKQLNLVGAEGTDNIYTLRDKEALHEIKLCWSNGYYHVDCNDGNDETGDGTVTNPFKTLTKLLQYADQQGKLDLRVYFLGAGTYEWTARASTFNAIHFKNFSSRDASGNPAEATDCDTVHISMQNSTGSDVAFYGTHINWSYLTFDFPAFADYDHLYFDNSLLSVHHCTFTGGSDGTAYVQCYGGQQSFANCTFRALGLSHSVTVLSNTHFTNTLNTGTNFVLNIAPSCDVTIKDAITYDAFESQASAWTVAVYAQGSTVRIKAPWVAANYGRALVLDGCIVMMNDTIYDSWYAGDGNPGIWYEGSGSGSHASGAELTPSMMLNNKDIIKYVEV